MCKCRKPQPGLLKKIIKDNGCYPKVFIGDNITDYYASEKIKVNFALVRTGMGSQFVNSVPRHIPVFDDLFCCVQALDDA
jgi:histidinol phosphatase-like enzyme